MFFGHTYGLHVSDTVVERKFGLGEKNLRASKQCEGTEQIGTGAGCECMSNLCNFMGLCTFKFNIVKIKHTIYLMSIKINKWSFVYFYIVIPGPSKMKCRR